MSNKKNNQQEISLEEIVYGWEPIFTWGEDDILALLQQVDESLYVALREQANSAFQIDGATEFKGVVQEETEVGDVVDVIGLMLADKYPPEKCSERSHLIMLSVEQRKAWRDDLIKELDEMVER